MSDMNWEKFQVNSGDFSTLPTDNAGKFRNAIQTIQLDYNKNYEVCVLDVMFVNNQDPASLRMKSVYLNCNLVQGTRIGSQSTNVILFMPKPQIILKSVNSHGVAGYGPGSSVFIQSDNNIKWYPLSVNSYINNVEVSLTLSTGDPIPVNGPNPDTGYEGDFTSVTFAIRECY